ncbi:MAG: hypothetical protein C4519_11430 [Desulfobacteraceae bacterium]|nr:MAG: hypothetical protein C4519_11430 [Desulfobacteraceae bacterium]
MELEGFELFKEHGRSFNPKISIRKRGQIGFNNGAINRCNLDKYGYVKLYYNKDAKMIAFKFTNDPKEEGAIKIQKRPSNYFFSGKSFLDYYSINYSETETFDLDWDEDRKVAMIDIKKHTEE